jgi:hypothetical protein
MKKLLGILVLGLLLSSNAYSKSANELNKERCEKNPDASPKCKEIIEKALEAKKTLNDYLNEGYKITKEELVKFDRSANKIFTLKKGRNVKVCTVKINAFGVSRNSKCMTP